MSFKIYFIFLAFVSCLFSFAQENNNEPLFFELSEIQVFDGLTNNGTQILKLDRNGILLRKIDLFGDTNHKSTLVNFRELEGKNLKNFRKNFTRLLEYLNEFDYKNYQPLKEKIEIQIIDGDTTYRESIHGFHDLGTRILIIDNNFESHFIRYYFCEEPLDDLIEIITQIIPKDIRTEYQFRKRCN